MGPPAGPASSVDALHAGADGLQVGGNWRDLEVSGGQRRLIR